MGRGRSFAGHKIVPPSGARWAPKPNAHARCVGRMLYGQKGGGKGGVMARFVAATQACRGGRASVRAGGSGPGSAGSYYARG